MNSLEKLIFILIFMNIFLFMKRVGVELAVSASAKCVAQLLRKLSMRLQAKDITSRQRALPLWAGVQTVRRAPEACQGAVQLEHATEGDDALLGVGALT